MIKTRVDKGVSVAKQLVKQKSIVGVIGPYSSRSVAHVMNEYCQSGLSLISPTSTSRIRDFQRTAQANLEKNLDNSCFFRPTGTSKEATEEVLDYLERKGYKNVLILYDDADMYALSFYNSLAHHISENPNILSERFSFNYQIDEQGNSRFVKKEIGKITEQIAAWKTKYENQSDKTVLVLIYGAYTDSQSTSKLEVIKANNGRFFIIGSNSVYEPLLLDKLKDNGFDNSSMEKMLITIPWFPSELDTDKQKTTDFRDYWQLDTNIDLTSYYAMSYDATQMLIDAIDKQKNGNSTRQKILNALKDANFEIKDGNTILLTRKKITLNGSDPEFPFFHLIKPDCSASTCRWKKLDLKTLSK